VQIQQRQGPEALPLLIFVALAICLRRDGSSGILR